MQGAAPVGIGERMCYKRTRRMRWVIGDIHGMYDALRGLIEAVGQRDGSPRFLFVGDYINRGSHTRRVIDLLLGLSGARFARGNHDDVLDLILHGSCYDPHSPAPRPAEAFAWFMHHGLGSTFTSYGVDVAMLKDAGRRPTPRKLQQIGAAVPEIHRRFIRELPPVLEEPDLFVAHAMWDVDTRDDAPSIAAVLSTTPRLRHRVLWGRYTADEIRGPKRWRRPGYFGHTPVDAFGRLMHQGRNVPIRGPRIVLLDTGAALGQHGRLSAVCAESNEVVQTDPSGKVVEAA